MCSLSCSLENIRINVIGSVKSNALKLSGATVIICGHWVVRKDTKNRISFKLATGRLPKPLQRPIFSFGKYRGNRKDYVKNHSCVKNSVFDGDFLSIFQGFFEL